MIVKDVMSAHVATVRRDDTIAQAAKIMSRHDIGVLPVVDENSLCGMITDRDIVLRCVADKKDAASTKVNEAMTENVISVNPNQSLNEALKAMADRQVKRLAVTENGEIKGIVSLGDIARIRSGSETAKTLTDISMP